jgi:hypothetical protein
MTTPYQGPERRVDLTGELRSISEGIGQLVQHMDQSLPEERVRALLEVALTEERHNRTRLIVAIVSPLLIVLAVALATLVQSSANHAQGARVQRTAADAAVVADYVRSCLEAPAGSRDPAKCGDDGTRVVKGLVGYLDCAFLIVPAERTQAKLDACATRAFAG